MSSHDALPAQTAPAQTAPVQNSAPPSRLRFYAVVTLPAGVLMALEIVSSRLLAPQFGNSVYVWGSIISVFLGTMSAGYWIGGRWADRWPQMTSLSLIILASAVGQAVILLAGRPLVAYLGELTAGRPEGVLLTTTLLFGPPTIFLAMVSPFAVKIATQKLSALGGTAGQLYALSTAGSLVGTLGATFFLIPRLALEPIFATLLAITAVTALLGLGPAWRQHKPAAVLAVSILALTVVPQHLFTGSRLALVTERLSPYQTLVVQDEGDIRATYSDGILHSAFDLRTGETAMAYSRLAAAALLLRDDIETVAVLGMGAGGVGRYLHSLRPDIVVDHVEVDRAVVDIASEHYGFEAGPNHRVHIEDARRFLVQRADQRWDFIYADTYIGHSIPFHLVTREFIREVRRHLTPGGVFGMNVVTDLDTPLSKGLLRGLSSAFDNVYVFQEQRRNFLFLATTAPDRVDADELRAAADALQGSFAQTPSPSMAELAASIRYVDLDLGDAMLFTDGYAPVNDLLRKSVDRSTFGVEFSGDDASAEGTSGADSSDPDAPPEP